jgi:hypothetical protein
MTRITVNYGITAVDVFMQKYDEAMASGRKRTNEY